MAEFTCQASFAGQKKIEAGSTCDEPINRTDLVRAIRRSLTNGASNRRSQCAFRPAAQPDQVERVRPMLWWLWHARGGFEVALRDGDYKLLATMVPQAEPGDVADAPTDGLDDHGIH